MNPDEDSLHPRTTIDHRRVDREGGRIITEMSEETLKARGYVDVGTEDDDGSIPSGQLVDARQKAHEFLMSTRGAVWMRGDSSLKETVEQHRQAGYDIRLYHLPYTKKFRVYWRFDLDRFITRMPEEKMGAEEYSLQPKRQFIYHRWGDSMEECTEAERGQYMKEIGAISRYVEECIKQNYHVVFIEKQHDNHYVLLPFTRQQQRERIAIPFDARRPLNGIAQEPPRLLLERGFAYLETVDNDQSLSQEKLLAFDGAYLASIDNLAANGIPPLPIKQKQPHTVRERIISAASRGEEIRAVQGTYDPITGKFVPDRSRFSLFRRFDLARFIEPPETTTDDLLADGFVFDKSFPILQWGDGSKAKEGVSRKALEQQQRIEHSIKEKESGGYRVRCVVGKYYQPTGILEPMKTFLSVFVRRK